jgi:hypothetical protein
MTLDELQARRDSILEQMGRENRIAIGDGREVEYPTQPELEAALQRVDAEIAKLQSPQSRQFTIQTSRGLA